MSEPVSVAETVRSRRWLAIALTTTAIAAIGVIAVVTTASPPDPLGDPQAGSTELPIISVIPPDSPSASPSTTVSEVPAIPAPNPQPTNAAPKPPTTTAAPQPKPSITTSAWGKCVWQEGRGWTIVVSVTVHNGSGVSASGTHGNDSASGGPPSETWSLDGGGSSFSGELPPDSGSVSSPC